MDITTLTEFINHEGFKMYNDSINQKIKEYKADLEVVNPLFNELKYNYKDLCCLMLQYLRLLKQEPVLYFKEKQVEALNELSNENQNSLKELNTIVGEIQQKIKED